MISAAKNNRSLCFIKLLFLAVGIAPSIVLSLPLGKITKLLDSSTSPSLSRVFTSTLIGIASKTPKVVDVEGVFLTKAFLFSARRIN